MGYKVAKLAVCQTHSLLTMTLLSTYLYQLPGDFSGAISSKTAAHVRKFLYGHTHSLQWGRFSVYSPRIPTFTSMASCIIYDAGGGRCSPCTISPFPLFPFLISHFPFLLLEWPLIEYEGLGSGPRPWPVKRAGRCTWKVIRVSYKLSRLTATRLIVISMNELEWADNKH